MAPVVSGGAGSDFMYILIVLPVLVIIGIILYLVFRSDTSGPTGATTLSGSRASRLLNTIPEEVNAGPQAVPEPVTEPVVPVVQVVEESVVPEAVVTNELEPKFNVAVSKYWSYEADEEEPHLENDGNTFSDFQRAFNTGREYLTEESSMKTYRNENHDTYMHEEKRSFVPKSNVSISDSRTIAMEAFQQVPRDMDRDNAVVLLREILAARTEAALIGLDLGEPSEDQVDDLKFWSTMAGPEAEVATAILSRI